MLFVPDHEVVFRDEAGAELAGNAHRFVSRLAAGRYLGYLKGQKRKLTVAGAGRSPSAGSTSSCCLTGETMPDGRRQRSSSRRTGSAPGPAVGASPPSPGLVNRSPRFRRCTAAGSAPTAIGVRARDHA